MTRLEKLAELEKKIAEQELYIEKCKDALAEAKMWLKELVAKYRDLKNLKTADITETPEKPPKKEKKPKA